MSRKQQNNAREVLKNIPSVDEILNEFHSDIPIKFFKFHINKILFKIREDVLNGKEIKNIKDYAMKKINKC